MPTSRSTGALGARLIHVEIWPGLVERGHDLGDYGPAKDGVDGKYRDKTSEAVKKFKADENLGNGSSGAVDRGVIMRLDELFPSP